MSGDARFEDGALRPLRLLAQDADDLMAISALVQDSVLPAAEMRWDRTARRFALLVNRFRWEDAEGAKRAGRAFERVQAVLSVQSVLTVRRSGFDPSDTDQVISLLGLTFEPGADGAGRVVLTLAGDGAIGVDVECLDVTLVDVTRPYQSVSGKAPDHATD